MSGLQLLLNGVQVVNLLLSRLQILRSPGNIVTSILLLLVEFVDGLILRRNFIVQVAEDVVPVGLLLLDLLHGQVKIFNVLLQVVDVSIHGLPGSSSVNPLGFSVSQGPLSSSQLGLHIGLLGSSLSLTILILRKIALLRSKLVSEGLVLLVEVLVGTFKFLCDIQCLFILAPGLIGPLLEHPQLILNVELVPEALSMHPPDQLEYNVVTSLLKGSESSSPEEDLSVAKPVFLP